MNREQVLEILFPRQDGPKNFQRQQQQQEEEEFNEHIQKTHDEGEVTDTDLSSLETGIIKEVPVVSSPLEELVCLVCLETIEESQHVTGLCEHVFHYNCLMAWMTKGHDNCPTCRQPLWDTPTFLSLLSNSTSTTHEDTEGGMASSLSSTHHHHPHSVFHQSRIQQQQRIFLDRDRLQQQRRRQEQAGFPWARCCQVFNLICFLAGVGYILGSLLGPSLSSSS